MPNEFDQLARHYSDVSTQTHLKGECGGIPGCQICLANLAERLKSRREQIAYCSFNLGEVISSPIPATVSRTIPDEDN